MDVVTVYEDADFQGNSAQLGEGRYDWGQLGIANDTLSSLKVPSGMVTTLYEDTHFSGRMKIFTEDASYVGDDFNDITSSIVVAIASIDFSIWSLQEPGGSGTSPTTISPGELVAGYSDAYFYKTADGGQAFMDTQTGIATPGSQHCRTELREMTASGVPAAWAPEGTNTMDVTGKVTLLGGGSTGKVTVGQVYNSNASVPLCELQYSAEVGGFVLLYEEAKGAGARVDLQTPVALNTPYCFQLSLTNGVLTVSINGKQVYSRTPSPDILDDKFYFKCGNYDQTASAGEVTDPPIPYTIVEIYSINVVHQA